MFTDLNKPLSDSFIEYINSVKTHPFEIVTFVIDIIIVIFLIYELIKRTKKSKVWQLVKGIALLIIMTILSGLLNYDYFKWIIEIENIKFYSYINNELWNYSIVNNFPTRIT